MKQNLRFLPAICVVGLTLSQSPTYAAAPNVVAGKSIGKISLGFTPAQVHKILGKPKKTFKLKNGLTDDLYTSKGEPVERFVEPADNKLEILYKAGKAVQIEVTSPKFVTKDGLSTDTPFAVLNKKVNPKRFYVYGTPDDVVSGASMYYLDNISGGIAFEYGGTQDIWFKDVGSTTLIVHRKGVPVLPDQGWIFDKSFSYVPADYAELK